MIDDLKPIKPKRISDQVFEQLRELMFRGVLKPGDRLLPERELGTAMNVSRSTVREAINKLIVMGLVEHRQGQGTFVRAPDPVDENPMAAAMRAKDARLEDLLEVRMGLECQGAALAARRADEGDLEHLDRILDQMAEEVATGRLSTHVEVLFHMAIAYATKNPVHVQTLRSFYDFFFYGIKKMPMHLYEEPGDVGEILKQSRRIVEAIRAHDPAAAFRAMEQHIAYALEACHGM